MYSEINPRDIVLGEMKIGSAFDEKLTEATLILAGMQRGDKQAFERALGFKFLNEQMSFKERYNRLFAFCKWGLERKRNVPVEGDAYASVDEWSALFKFSKQSRK